MGDTQDFQNKLRGMCRILRGEEKHWIPVGALTVRIPGSGEVSTLRRVVYAAFTGPIPADHDVRSNCGMRACVCPSHAELVESRTGARALDLSSLLVPESVEEPEVVEIRRPTRTLPAEVLAQIKQGLSQGAPISLIARRVSQSPSVVVGVNNGLYRAAG